MCVCVCVLHRLPNGSISGLEPRGSSEDSNLSVILRSRCAVAMIPWGSVESLSRVWLFATPWTAARQASLVIGPSPMRRVYPVSRPLSQWCHPTISSSVIPFSSRPQSFPVSGSFKMTQLFTSGGQSIAVSASTSVLPVNTHDWSPLGWTGWISLQYKGLSRVFSTTTVQKHQFFGSELSL